MRVSYLDSKVSIFKIARAATAAGFTLAGMHCTAHKPPPHKYSKSKAPSSAGTNDKNPVRLIQASSNDLAVFVLICVLT